MTGPDLVTVFRGGDEPGLSVARSLLEDAGIPYVTKSTGVQDLFGAGRAGLGYSAVTGPPEIQVRAEDASRAWEVLNLHSGEISEQELAELAERTSPQEEEPGPSVGMNGLRAIVGLVVVVFPIWLGYDIINALLNLNSKGWREFTTPGAPYYHPFWTWYRVADPLFGAALLVWSIFVLELFRSNDHRFAKAMMILLSAEFLTDVTSLVCRAWLGAANLNDIGEIQRPLGAAILWAICLPYLVTSNHVSGSAAE